MIKKLITLLLLLGVSVTVTFGQALNMNGVTVNMNFLDVTNIHGWPGYLGPALENVSEVNSIITPPPFAVSQMTKTGSGGGSGSGSGSSITPSSGGGSNTAELTPIGRQGYGILYYKYDEKIFKETSASTDRPGYNFYIFINNNGRVDSVIAWLVPGQTVKNFTTPHAGITFGSTQFQVISSLGQPNAATRIGEYLIYSYGTGQNKVTYSFDSSSKLIGICLSSRMLTLVHWEQQQSQTGTGGFSGGMLPPSSGILPSIGGGGVYPR